MLEDFWWNIHSSEVDLYIIHVCMVGAHVVINRRLTCVWHRDLLRCLGRLIVVIGVLIRIEFDHQLLELWEQNIRKNLKSNFQPNQNSPPNIYQLELSCLNHSAAFRSSDPPWEVQSSPLGWMCWWCVVASICRIVLCFQMVSIARFFCVKSRNKLTIPSISYFQTYASLMPYMSFRCCLRIKRSMQPCADVMHCWSSAVSSGRRT